MAALWYVLLDRLGRRWCAPDLGKLLGFLTLAGLAPPPGGPPGRERDPWAVPGTRTISGRPAE